MYLIFDVSSIDKPKNWKAPFSDTFSWPRMIHISWIILNKDLKPMKDYDCIVRPEGFSINETIEKRCRIQKKELDEKGESLDDVLKQFNASLKDAQYLFAHNMNFNENVLAAEYLRQGLDHDLFKTERVCLMQESTFYCKIPSKQGGYKWPSLGELHATIFKQKYSPAGNARADVIAAARSFIALMKVGAFEDLFDDE